MKKLALLLIIPLMLTGCTKRDEMKLKSIIEKVQTEESPLFIESNLSYWFGTTTGNPAEFEKYTTSTKQLSEIFTDKETFNQLKKLRNRNVIKNPLLKRQLEVLYLSFLKGQADTSIQNQIIEKMAVIEQKFAMYRANYKGQSINDNMVEEILHTSTNNKDLEEVWKAHKAIGPVVAEDILDIVRLRNKMAQELGYDNYHTLSLILNEQDPEEIASIFDELDKMTADGFAELKVELDKSFSKRYGISEDKLMPWHYQDRFFQEAPNLYPVDLDKYYKGKDLEKLILDFYSSIGLDVTKIMENSDLYPKDNKNQHAYCTDIDRNGDIRVLCNSTDNEHSMSVMLHEFGHGVYAMGHDLAGNPYFLRDAAQPFTTEGVAMMFEKMSRNPEWMRQMLGISQEESKAIAEDCAKSAKLQQLVFSRWTQVVYRFEKELYANPEQDLNTLWWNLVEKYQLLRRPEGRNEPDWASKIHFAIYPCYYHNYQLGALFASQMHHYITTNITKTNDMKKECYVGNKAVGEWIQEYVFNPGKCLDWNEMTEHATGEKLTAKYYKMQFVD